MISGPPSSWTSPQAEFKAKLERLQQNASYIGLSNSPFFPRKVSEYVEHKTGYLADALVETNQRSARMIESNAVETKINIHHATKSLSGAETSTRDAENRKAKKSFNVLGAPGDTTTIWRPEYTIVPEKRDDVSIWGPITRASWPNQNETKAEGEYRMATFAERRLPLPRRDKLSQETVKAELAMGVPIEVLADLKGGDITFYRREVVEMTGLDKLESVEKAKNDPRKTYTIHEALTPSRTHLRGDQRIPNNQPSTRARYSGQRNNHQGNRNAVGGNQHDLGGIGVIGGMGLEGHGMLRYGNRGQDTGRPNEMLGDRGNKDFGASNLGFTASANRAVTGGRGSRQQRAGRGNMGRGGYMTATPAPPAPQKSAKEKATTDAGDNEDDAGSEKDLDPFEEFKSEEAYMKAKSFSWLMDDM